MTPQRTGQSHEREYQQVSRGIQGKRQNHRRKEQGDRRKEQIYLYPSAKA